MTRTAWRVASFDDAVPVMLNLVLDSDEPRAVALVEQAAHAWGVELERTPAGMTSLQALVTGAIAGALVQAADNGLLVNVETVHDQAGNYLPELTVTGRESGEVLRVTVEVAGEPEA